MVDVVAIITLALALGEKFLALMRMGCKKLVPGRNRANGTNNSHVDELSYLHHSLLYLRSANVLGLASQPALIDELLKELLSSVDHAKNVLNPPHKRLSSQETQLHMAALASKIELQVDRALQKMLGSDDIQGNFISKEGLKVMKGIIDGKRPTEEKMGAMISFMKKEVCDDLELRDALSFVLEDAFLMLFDRMLFRFLSHGLIHERLPQAPEVEGADGLDMLEGKKTTERESNKAKQAKRHGEISGNGMITFMKKEVCDDLVQKEAPSLFLQDVCYSTEAFQMLLYTAGLIDKHLLQAKEVEKKITEGESNKAKQAKEQILRNPNRTLGIVAEEGKGEIRVSECEGNQWRVVYKGSSTKHVRLVRGDNQMQVIKELGYHYYEVKLMEMGWVGVGLAHHRHYKDNEVAGRYRKSYGYDGKAGLALCENHPCNDLMKVGSLVAGDTLGIGLFTEHEGSPFVFLIKNGVLQGAMPKNLHLSKSSYNLLYPVISLASLHVEILVNFSGPFVLPPNSDLIAAAKKASASA